jgi:hypothetical protein
MQGKRTVNEEVVPAALAEVKALFRVVNEEIEGVHETLGDDRPEFRCEFLCECGRDDCSARISMTFEEYERVRAKATRFAVRPGHEWPGFERVVEANPRFAVVETKSEAVAQVSIARDPRSRSARLRRARPSFAPSPV